MDIKTCFLIFLVYSVMGWCMETIVCMIESKKFVNRGFLIGPCCPIYGCGGLLITLILSQISDYPIIVFFSAILICGTLEYFTSFIMEKLFNARWWDYSHKKFNINGRVCLSTASMFGILSCIILYVTNPTIFMLLSKLSSDTQNIIIIICASIFVIDCIVTLTVVSGITATIKQLNNSRTSDNTEEITKKVKEILISKSVLARRLINAFPKLSIEGVKRKIKETTEQVKENVEKVKENVEKVKENATEHIKESAAQVKESTSKFIKNRKNK